MVLGTTYIYVPSLPYLSILDIQQYGNNNNNNIIKKYLPIDRSYPIHPAVIIWHTTFYIHTCQSCYIVFLVFDENTSACTHLDTPENVVLCVFGLGYSSTFFTAVAQ